MSLDTILGLAGLSLALGGLWSEWRGWRHLLAILLILLVVTSGALAYRRLGHERQLRGVQEQVLRSIAVRPRSVDDIYSDLRYVDFALVSEAVSRCVEEGNVHYKLIDLQMYDGSFTKVMVYYRP